VRQARPEWSGADYQTVLRWPVDADTDRVLLRLGRGVDAVEFLASQGRDVLAVLRARNVLGPVLTLPGELARWVFRTSPDNPGAVSSSVAMVGARLRMTAPDTLTLPPTVTADGPTRWILAPGPGTVALPRLPVVLSAAWQTVAV
jgi:hypothetical protein